jgi:hypothetical protein
MSALKTLGCGFGQDAFHSTPLEQGESTPSEAMITRTTKITIETESMLVVRQGRTVVTWCPKCQAEVEVMLCEDTSVAQLLGGIRAGSLHVCRPAGSSTQICLPSLLQLSQPSEVQQVHIPERTLTNEGEGQ